MAFQEDYGILLNPNNLKLQRIQFNQMVKLLGINLKYYPIKNKHYTTYAELISNPSNALTIGCIFTDHIDQKTMKKLGWVSELVEGALVANLPYDTPDLEVGCLIEIPSGLDNAESRLFRISRISNIMITPASLTCECVPEYINTIPVSEINDFRNDSTKLLLKDEDDDLC